MLTPTLLHTRTFPRSAFPRYPLDTLDLVLSLIFKSLPMPHNCTVAPPGACQCSPWINITRRPVLFSWFFYVPCLLQYEQAPDMVSEPNHEQQLRAQMRKNITETLISLRVNTVDDIQQITAALAQCMVRQVQPSALCTSPVHHEKASDREIFIASASFCSLTVVSQCVPTCSSGDYRRICALSSGL